MLRVPRYAPWYVRVSMFLGVFVSWNSDAAAFQKTDIIELNNGDKITCEIKELERGKLRCSTDAMGTVYIEWERIVNITTDKTLEVETSQGQRYFGSLEPLGSPTSRCSDRMREGSSRGRIDA